MTPHPYPVPTASIFVDMAQYIPLLLAAVDVALDNEYVWDEADADTALGYIGDLKLWLSLLENIMFAPVGSVVPFTGTLAPDGWLLCNGQAVSRTTYDDLFGVIGTSYGAGDGSTTFNLPDMRGRAPIGAGQGTGLTNRVLASQTGAETHTLTEAQIPAHAHPRNTSNFADERILRLTGGGGAGFAGGTLPGFSPGLNTGNAGGGQAHNNMQPSIALNFIIFTGA